MEQLNMFDTPIAPVKKSTSKKPKSQQKLNKEEEDILKKTVQFLYILMAKRIQKGETKPVFAINIHDERTGISMSFNVRAKQVGTYKKAKLFIEK